MLNILIYLIGIIFPTAIVYIVYKQNKLNSQYFYNIHSSYTKSYYLTLFLSSLYFVQYFLRLTIPNVDSLHSYSSIANQYLNYASKYFTFENFINNSIKIYFCSIPLTIFLYLSFNSLNKLQSFAITLIFLILIEPSQYMVNLVTASQYHYISFLEIVFPSLGAGLGMIILIFVPQITRFKKYNFAEPTSSNV